TVSSAGIPGPEMTVPADNDIGEAVVTVVLPLVVLATKVLVVVVVVGISVPAMVIPNVSALVEAVVTVVLPLVVSAVIVEDNPGRTEGLPELWHATQNVGFVAGS